MTTPPTPPVPPAPPLPPAPPIPQQYLRIDFTLLISIVALLIASWAANETRETRLDTKRIQLRGDAFVYIQEMRTTINMYNCYGLVKGAKMEGKTDFMRFLEGEEKKIREGLSELNSFGPDALAIYEAALNKNKGQLQNKVYVMATEIRNSWDKDLREKADSVCKIN